MGHSCIYNATCSCGLHDETVFTFSRWSCKLNSGTEHASAPKPLAFEREGQSCECSTGFCLLWLHLSSMHAECPSNGTPSRCKIVTAIPAQLHNTVRYISPDVQRCTWCFSLGFWGYGAVHQSDAPQPLLMLNTCNPKISMLVTE